MYSISSLLKPNKNKQGLDQVWLVYQLNKANIILNTESSVNRQRDCELRANLTV